VFEGDNWRDVPKELNDEPTVEIGPAIYEQLDYHVYVKAHSLSDQVSIQHRDPQFTQRLSFRENNRVAYGVINFQGQIGLSTFTVAINGKPQLDIEVEVFPTKIDYETDYKELLSQIQEVLTSLAYEYLRSTHQLGKLDTNRRPSRLEWLILLEHILGDLVKSVRYIAQQPRKSLVRRPNYNRIDRIRRTDSSVRVQVRRGAGRGVTHDTIIGPIRERLLESPSEPTLDTMEHRWIKRQLTDIRRTLGLLHKSLGDDSDAGERRRATQSYLRNMENRISQLLRLEPIAEANGSVPGEFASLQLVSAPGYKETYRLCLLLKFGLHLEGDIYRLSVKDLNVLYEYWVFLSIVQLLREPNVSNTDLRDLFKLNRSSLQVRLLEGRQQRVDCVNSKDRKISVTYNFQYDADDITLIPQKPDIIIRYEEVGWPQTLLVCDAKYRIDASDEYRQQFGSFGPPRDAVNVLHRYRDAILEIEKEPGANGVPKHVVVQAVAAFPYAELQPGEFQSSRLWQSIDRFGIGAMPALPSNQSYMRQWLVQALQKGGWAMADRVIPHLAEGRSRDWRVAASEPVLIGVLRSPGAAEHLDWIKRQRMYYQPHTKSQRRQYFVKQVALYVPIGMQEPIGIRYIADVEQIEIVDRSEIPTPWPATRSESMMLYRLGPVRLLTQPITLSSQDSMSGHWRWTTRLGLQRAQTLSEVGLETEPEWRFLEWLRANQIVPEIKLSTADIQSIGNPKGRAWFHLPTGERVRFDGSNGFLWRVDGSPDRYMTLQTMMQSVLAKECAR
jgi:predicted component of viral defense system (DUF524 family)